MTFTPIEEKPTVHSLESEQDLLSQVTAQLLEFPEDPELQQLLEALQQVEHPELVEAQFAAA